MKKHLKQLDLKRIRITDSLFGEYVNKVSEKIIPHQWKILNDQLEDSEPTYCIHNFRIAAGEEKGERKGVVFQDTDLYKWLEAVAYTIAGGRGEHLEELAEGFEADNPLANSSSYEIYLKDISDQRSEEHTSELQSR